MTGWTVIYQDKLSQFIEVFVNSVNYINTTRCGKLLYYLYDKSEMNTHCMVSFLLISNVFPTALPLLWSGQLAGGGASHPMLMNIGHLPLLGRDFCLCFCKVKRSSPRWGGARVKRFNNIRANDVKKSSTWGQSAWITTT